MTRRNFFKEFGDYILPESKKINDRERSLDEEERSGFRLRILEKKAVYVPTQEEYLVFVNVCEKWGWKSLDGSRLTIRLNYLGEKACGTAGFWHGQRKVVGFGERSTFEPFWEIITLKEFFEEQKIV